MPNAFRSTPKTFNHTRKCAYCGTVNDLLDTASPLVCSSCGRVVQQGWGISDAATIRCPACQSLFANQSSYADHLPCEARVAYDKRRANILLSVVHFEISRKPSPKRRPKPTKLNQQEKYPTKRHLERERLLDEKAWKPCEKCQSTNVKVMRGRMWLHCNTCNHSFRVNPPQSTVNVRKQRAES